MEIINEFDELQIYGGSNYRINDDISIRQPTLGEIKDYGEKNYFGMINTLCSVGADLKWQLNDYYDVDYTKVSDYELFCFVLSKRYTKEDTRILFGDILDFSQMKIQYADEIEDNVMIQYIDSERYIIIDKFIYSSIVNILRKMHKFKRNDELPGNESTRRILIDDAREEYEQNKNKPSKSYLMPMISTMVNSEGFKRNDATVFDMRICPFMDSVARIGKIKNAELLLQSGYSGFGVDLKNVDKDSLNYMGELD